MPDGRDLGRPPRRSVLAEVTAASDPRPSQLRRLHRLAVLVLFSALVLAIGLPVLAKPRKAPAEPPVVEPVAPPTPQALTLLDAAIAEGRLADARALIAPMWAADSPEVALRVYVRTVRALHRRARREAAAG